MYWFPRPRAIGAYHFFLDKKKKTTKRQKARAKSSNEKLLLPEKIDPYRSALVNTITVYYYRK